MVRKWWRDEKECQSLFKKYQHHWFSVLLIKWLVEGIFFFWMTWNTEVCYDIKWSSTAFKLRDQNTGCLSLLECVYMCILVGISVHVLIHLSFFFFLIIVFDLKFSVKILLGEIFNNYDSFPSLDRLILAFL